MKEIVCPVCKSKETKRAFTAYGSHGKSVLNAHERFYYYTCTVCHAVFLTGVQFTKAYYKKYYHSLISGTQSLAIRAITLLIEKISLFRKSQILRKFQNKRKKNLRVLDIGCGNGNFLSHLNPHIYDRYGIELDPNEYKKCLQKNFTVYNEDILKKNFGNTKFDIITMWHVIEHITDPNALLKKVGDILQKDGILVFATPNIDSFGFKLSKTNWFHLDAPRHVILYPEHGIETLCRKNKFTILSNISESFEFPLDLFWSIKKTRAKMSIIYFLLYPFIKMRAKETLIYVTKKNT